MFSDGSAEGAGQQVLWGAGQEAHSALGELRGLLRRYLSSFSPQMGRCGLQC